MSAGRETEHWPEIYHTANGYKVQCECGWDSKSIKGANPDEGLKVMWKEHVAALREWKEHVAALREPGADTGTTPPEGLDAGVRAALECAEYALTHPGSNQHFALTAVRHVMAELDAAATQRAPVEHGPSVLTEAQADRYAAFDDWYDAALKRHKRDELPFSQRAACDYAFEAGMAAAPDHAREGALREARARLNEANWWNDRTVGTTVKNSELNARVSECEEAVRRARADGKEGGE